MSEIKLSLKQRIRADELHEAMVENRTYEEAAYALIFYQDEISRLATELAKARKELPEDVRSFIYTVTLFLQANRAKTPEQMDSMFHQAYKLYTRYDVEGRLKEAAEGRKEGQDGKE